MNIQIILANNIRFFRRLRDLTQEELAKKSGLSLASIQLIETARRWPGIKNINRICLALDISNEKLFSERKLQKQKIIQIINGGASYDEELDDYIAFQTILYALCDDGTTWEYYANNEGGYSWSKTYQLEEAIEEDIKYDKEEKDKKAI